MASSAPKPKDWGPTRRRLVAAGAVSGLGVGLWAPVSLGLSAAWTAVAGLAAGAVAGWLLFLAVRWAIRRLHRALVPRMRPDRLS